MSRRLLSRTPRLLAGLALVVVTLSVALSASSPVLAHADFESSTPADGAVIDSPVELVTVTFTAEVAPVGEEFVALTPAGVLQEPVEVTTLDDETFHLRFDPPLAGGAVGVRWTVKSPDLHPIDGAFSFEVTASAVTSTSAAPVTTTTEVTTTAATTPVTVPATSVVDAVVVADDARDDDDSAQSLDEFLGADASLPGEGTATIGRLIGLLGVVGAIGWIALLFTALRGTRSEIEGVVLAARIAGVVVMFGAVIELVGVTRMGGSSVFDTATTAAGTATVLRILGGLAVAAGLRATLSGDARRWEATGASGLAFVGVAALVVSFWFDGHTVTEGFRPLHAIVNTVHVVAGSVWAGGVVGIAVLAWARQRAGRPARLTAMVVRFSKVATLSLVAVGLAGVLMAGMVLDSFGDLTSTQWGKMLLLKTAAVALAAGAGAYNHFRLLPALEANPDDADVQAKLRSTMTAEAIVLVFVVVVTAFLVAAAT